MKYPIVLGGTLDNQSGRDQGRRTHHVPHGADSLREIAPVGHAKSSDVSQTQNVSGVPAAPFTRGREGRCS